ncbi:MAG: hypothetical protein KBG84_04405 [Planctomycetes bacterium]|nr:hypothetical protein [Planctomycetota bacterium]
MAPKNRTVKPISEEGRKRVEAALEKYGLLLVQGQWELPSLADLIEGAPIKVRGFSYDYLPAWNLREELCARADIALCKLFRGKSTLVHKRHWALIDSISRMAQRGVAAGRCEDMRRVMYEVIKAKPGITGEQLKKRLELSGKTGSAKFQRAKADLEQWLAIVGEDEPTGESHTHDQHWRLWAEGRIAKGVEQQDSEPTLFQAADALMKATFPDGLPPKMTPMKMLYPALALLS